MKAKVGIVVLIGGIVAFAAVSMYVGAVKAGAGTHSFARYYEPCEPEISFNFTDYQLPLDMNDIVNMNRVGEVLDVNSISDSICQNGFAVTQAYSIYGNFPVVDFVEVYRKFRDQQNPPIFITADTGLYLYHAVFDQTFREIEERLFIPDIKDLITILLNNMMDKHEQFDGNLKEAARRNIAFLSVAQKLMDPNAAVTGLVEAEVNSELYKIEAHRGMADSDIFKYSSDYSQYMPRGHYTRNEELERYFKTIMWFGRMTFLIKGRPEGLISRRDAEIQTMQAFMLAESLKNVKVQEQTGLEIWERIYTVTSFFVGFADDLTPKDYLWAIDKVFGKKFELSNLTEENNFNSLKEKLANLKPPKIYDGTGNIVVPTITEESLNKVLDKTKGMRFMGQRLIPDSYIFGRLTYPNVGSYTGDQNKKPFTADNKFGNRSYIRGLDLMAVLGSNDAKEILTNDGDTDFENYQKRYNEMKAEFNSLDIHEWNQNLYWSWLYCLKGLLRELPKDYPRFMQTRIWNRSRLNAALASWTQLRHDTILYGKYVAPPPPFMMRVPPGYVEPNPVFWSRLLALTQMTRLGLEDFNIRTNNIMKMEILRRIDYLEKLLQKLLDISIKQLANEPLSEEERFYIEDLSGTLFGLAMDYDTYEPTRATLVADVHSFPSEGLVIEEGVGFVDLMVVACPLADGKAFLAAGPVFSYYEFKHLMKDRLTDEAWEKMLQSSEKPERPKWYQPLMRQKAKSSSE